MIFTVCAYSYHHASQSSPSPLHGSSHHRKFRPGIDCGNPPRGAVRPSIRPAIWLTLGSSRRFLVRDRTAPRFPPQCMSGLHAALRYRQQELRHKRLIRRPAEWARQSGEVHLPLEMQKASNETSARSSNRWARAIHHDTMLRRGLDAFLSKFRVGEWQTRRAAIVPLQVIVPMDTPMRDGAHREIYS